MKVKDLIAIINKAKEDNNYLDIDDFDVVVDTEARRYLSHLYEVEGVNFIFKEVEGVDCLVLVPDFSGTEL